MSTTRKLWLGLGALLLVSFARAAVDGRRDLPQGAADAEGGRDRERADGLYTRADMETGRQVWQSIGGQQLGSIWGHGALVAPDWSADWLHREAVEPARAAGAAATSGRAYAELDGGRTGEPEGRRCARSCARNTYDAAERTLDVSGRSRAGDLATSPRTTRACSATTRPRTRCAKPMRCATNTVDTDASIGARLTAFFFWTSWAAVTQRPGATTSYTNNWPYEPLVGNTPTPSCVPVDGVQRRCS